MEQPTLFIHPPAAPLPTPDAGWPAQANLTPREAFLKRVREDVTTLLGVASTLESPKTLRLRDSREHARRQLAGVIAHCEDLRLALERGRA